MRRNIKLSALKKIFGNTNKFYRTVKRIPEFAAVHAEWAAGGHARLAKASSRTQSRKRVEWLSSLLPKTGNKGRHTSLFRSE